MLVFKDEAQTVPIEAGPLVGGWLAELREHGIAGWLILSPLWAESAQRDLVAASTLKCAQIDPGWRTWVASRPPGVTRMDAIGADHCWARQLGLAGYVSLVHFGIPHNGLSQYELIFFGPRAYTSEAAAAIAWATLNWWPKILKVVFEARSSLTGREAQCVKLLAQGHSTPQVALQVDCSERTVRFHIENAMSKLGAGSSLQAVLRALHLGLTR